MTCSRARTSFPRLTGDHFSSLLPVASLAFFLALGLELVTSSHLLPVRGAFLWSFLSPFVSRLTSHLQSSCRSSYSYFRAISLSLPLSILSLLPTLLLFRLFLSYAAPRSLLLIVGVYSHSPSARYCRRSAAGTGPSGKRCFGKAGRIGEPRL